MKNVILIGGMTVASALSSQAALVFTEDFSGAYANTNDATTFDGTAIAPGSWFGSSNAVGISAGDLSFANSAANRNRGSGVWLDTTGWSIGTVTVEVDVANFVAGADTTIFFQAYAATGVDVTNTVSMDIHGSVSAGTVVASTGTATINLLGAEQAITADGTDVAFTFNYNGTDDFVALTFVQRNAAGGSDFGSADLDDLTVNTAAVPEPSSLALLGLAGLALIRRRRN